MARGPRIWDKADWHAANFDDAVPEERAFVRGGMLVAWLADVELLAPDAARRVAAARKRESPAEVYRWEFDGKLSERDLTEHGNAFADAYVGTADDPATLPVSYAEDADELEQESGGPYTTPDDEPSYARFRARLDQRYAEWLAMGSPGRTGPEHAHVERRLDELFARRPALPAASELVLVAIGAPAPWPAWGKPTVWRPDTEEQREAARAIRGPWLALVPTARPVGCVTEAGRIGVLAKVEAVAGARVDLVLPPPTRVRVLGPAGDGLARVARVETPSVAPTAEVEARIRALDRTWRAEDGEGPGVVADRVAWPRARTTGELRALLDAIDPIARLAVAERLGR